MKILLFMDVFIFGGCEKMLKEVSDQLIQNGHSVDLLLIYKSDSNTYLKMLNPKMEIKYIWDVDKKSPIIKRGVFWLNVLFPEVVSRKVDISDYDWIINFKDDCQTNLIASKFSCKKIAWVHNITEDYPVISRRGIKFVLADLIYKHIYRKFLNTFTTFDEVICVSKHAQKSLEAHCPHRINSTVIYNYIDADRIQCQAREKIANVKFPFTMCYVGRLSAEKGVIEIVRATCELIKKGYALGLMVIGEGYQLRELQQIVSSSNCGDDVLFLGAKDNPYPYIINSDVILCASHKESFGLVVLESILLKRWVVSTCCGGPEELIEDGVNGTLVSDYDAFKEAIESIYVQKPVPKKSNILDIGNLKNEFYKKLNCILN